MQENANASFERGGEKVVLSQNDLIAENRISKHLKGYSKFKRR
jgi:hypothetical protein